MKKLSILFLSIFLSFFPLVSFCDFSYADTDPSPTWTYVTQQNDEPGRTIVVGAIKAYLGGRGYNNIFTYSAEKAIVQWSYNNWDNFARSKGYNGLSDLNNHIAYRYNSNGVLQFFLDNTSLEMLNQMYSAILEYYNISENTNKQIYNSEYFTDLDGNGCYVYQAKVIGAVDSLSNLYTVEGTRYLYSGFLLKTSQELRNHIFHLTSSNPSVQLTYYTDGDLFYGQYSNNKYILYRPNITSSDLIIFKYQNSYYFGILQEMNNSPVPYRIYDFLNLNNASAVNAAISAAQAGMNAGIVANGKSAAISTGKEGADALKDYIEDNDSTDDDVIAPVDEPTPPDDPIGPFPVAPSIPVGIINNMPINIQLPDLDDLIPDPIEHIPNGFTIPGLRYKFPFCIPFDMIAIYEVLDQTPQAPYFKTEINFASFNYDLVIDLEEYDPYMIHIRNYFLILYIFGLLFITPKLLKA